MFYMTHYNKNHTNSTDKPPTHLYKGKYRVPSTRMIGADYTSGMFFVTWCTHNRIQVLSKIVDNGVQLTEIGNVVNDEWLATANMRPNVVLDAWVIMPNHVHGILKLEGENESLGTIIAQIKSMATKRIRALGHADFAWQTRYFDRILHNERALLAARDYIDKNPQRWIQDIENVEGLFM
jgi:REP element-mobilizing transposase RayT